MIPILYQTITEGTVPNDYGLGALSDCISCTITEERNGAYELTMTYSADGIHAEDIEPNRFIKAKPNYTDDPQLFRIYKVGKTMNGQFTVSAQHISYDLSGKLILDGSAGSCVAACALLDNKAGNFTITTDKATQATFSVSEPSSVRSWFGGKEGSLLDVYGGEWQYDNYTARLLNARGTDRGVTIRYGKNLTQLSQELDMSNLVTGIVPYYIDTNGNKTVGALAPTGLTLDVPREVAIDFSQDVDPESSTPIATQLANLATRYKNNNNLTSFMNSITLDFVQLESLTERVDLCDTVHIYFEALGISASAKCISTTWDVLADRYISTTFGDARTNIADTLAAQAKELVNTPTKAEMNRATQLITGNLGGYVILHDSNGDGLPDEILIMDTPDIGTATKVWRWNKNGLGYSNNGYQGPYGLAMTSDGEINANFIKAGIISDVQGNSTIDMTNGEANLKDLKAKESLKLIDSSNKVRAELTYSSIDSGSLYIYDGNGNKVVYLQMNYNGGLLELRNSSLVPVATIQSDRNENGHVNICSASGNRAASLDVSTSGGLLRINDSNGNTVGYLFAGTAGDGTLNLYDSSQSVTINLSGQTGVVTCVSVRQTSSRKVKENIKPIEDAKKILDLNAVSFDYKNKEQGTNKRGFIAEDVAEVLPNLVTPETEETPATLDYIGMIPYLQDVLKAQAAEIKELKAELAEIKNKVGG